MAISYKPLRYLLVEKEMSKEDLKRSEEITGRVSESNYVNFEAIKKIYHVFKYKVENIVEIKYEEN